MQFGFNINVIIVFLTMEFEWKAQVTSNIEIERRKILKEKSRLRF